MGRCGESAPQPVHVVKAFSPLLPVESSGMQLFGNSFCNNRKGIKRHHLKHCLCVFVLWAHGWGRGRQVLWISDLTFRAANSARLWPESWLEILLEDALSQMEGKNINMHLKSPFTILDVKLLQ